MKLSDLFWLLMGASVAVGIVLTIITYIIAWVMTVRDRKDKKRPASPGE